VTYHYIVEQHPSGKFEREHSRAKMILRVTRFCSVGWKFRFRERHERYPQSFGLNRVRAIRRMRYLTGKGDAGFKLFIQRRRDGAQLSILKVEYVPLAPDLGANDEIEKAYGVLVLRFGGSGIINGGIYYCRFVDGTTIVSHHGYLSSDWKGGAGDVFSSPDTMDDLYDRARFLVGEVRAKRLKLTRIICGDDVWESYDAMVQPHPYNGVYHRHVHFEVEDGHPCNP
jgi:hypothetical protein